MEEPFALPSGVGSHHLASASSPPTWWEAQGLSKPWRRNRFLEVEMYRVRATCTHLHPRAGRFGVLQVCFWLGTTLPWVELMYFWTSPAQCLNFFPWLQVYGDKDADGFYRGETCARLGLIPCNMVSEIQADDEEVMDQLLRQGFLPLNTPVEKIGKRQPLAHPWTCRPRGSCPPEGFIAKTPAQSRRQRWAGSHLHHLNVSQEIWVLTIGFSWAKPTQ